MKVTFWGTRGSIPSGLTPTQVEEKICRAILKMPGIPTGDEPAVRAYVSQLPALQRGTAGGETSCVHIQAQEHTFIIDAGSGLRKLGLELVKGPCGRGQGVLHLFISHTHWDHILGFPFFTPAFIPGNRLLIYGIHDLKQALTDQQNPRNFPVPLAYMRSTMEFVTLQAGQAITIGPVSVNTLKNIHPGDSYAFRFQDQHSSFVYASDVEYKDLFDAHARAHIEFFQDADALVFDSQYTLRESWQKEDWGHSSALIGVDLARAAGIKTLLLFHHDPTYSDADLEQIQRNAVEYQAQDQTRPPCEIIITYEGLSLDLTPPGAVSVQLAPDAETAILTPTRVFDERGVTQLAQQLDRMAESAGSIIDLAQVETLTTASLKMLVKLRSGKQSGPIILAAPSANVRQIIQLAGYADYFAIYPTVQAALAAAQARESLNLPGQIVHGRYQIQDHLGASPLGTVIKATDLKTNRAVVLKILSPVFGAETLSRFMRYARPVVTLDHEHIVRVLAWEHDQDHTFQVAEFVGGQTLDDLLRNDPAPLPIDRALDIFTQIASALEYAHSRGVIHGNLKPANVFLTESGVKLSGFGLGRLVQGHNLIESPALFLVPTYLPPEQILGQPLDARTDLYALGVILYQLLTGRLPFEGADQDVMQAHLHTLPPTPGQFNPLISPSLEHLALKLLAKNPNERYASVQQAWHILDSLAVRADETAPARKLALVGREKPLEFLRTCWQQAQAGHGQLVFITGEQGVGKTALAHQAAAQCENAVLLIAHCREQAGSSPYHLFSLILKSYLATVPSELFDEQVRQPLSCLVQLAPEIHQILPDLPALPPLEPEQEQLRLMTHLAQFIKLATHERPWLVILDDLQWADSGSLELVRYLGRHLPTMAFFIIGLYRDTEVEGDHILLTALQDLSRHPACRFLPLERLDPLSVERMLSHLWEHAVPPALAYKIYQHTGGNPFYVEEIAKGLVDDGIIGLREGEWRFPAIEDIHLPPSVHAAVERRISHLSPDTQALLRQASVLGLTFKLKDLCVLSNLSERQVLEHLDAALERQLVQEIAGAALRFRHTEIQRVLYENLGELRRRLLHRQAAQALEQRYWPNTAPIAEELAHHLYQASEFEQAIVYSLQAGRQAQVAYANELALLWYRRTLEMLDRLEPEKAFAFQMIRVMAHQSLGDVLTLVGRYDEALEQSTTARGLLEAQPASDPRQMAELCRQTAFVYERRSQYDLALTWLNRGLRYLDSNEPTPELMQIYRLTGRIYTYIGDYKAANTHLECVLTLAQPARLRQMEADSWHALGLVAWHMGDYARAYTLGEQALHIAREIGDRRREAWALDSLGLAMMEHNVQAQSYFEQSLGIVREIGDRHLEGFVLDSLGRVFYYKHEYARSKSYYEQALACDVEIDHRYGRAESLAHLGDLYQAIGDYAQAQARYAQAIDIFREMGSWAGEGDTLAKLARLHYHLGDAEIAYEHSQQALSIAQEWGMRAVEKRVWIDLGHALTGLGRLAEAAENYQQAVDGAQPDRCCESLEAMAGLANICLVQNDPDRALTIVEKVMGCIQQGKSALYGIIEPMWIYLVCARTLRATRDPRTAEILAIAYRLLQEQAAQLPAELRPMFLEAVPAHRELAKLANIRDVQVLC